jgi:uncharacterized tellurite resistance protein B-like protein/uncharacterized coiled-coil protein SlyX
MPDTQHLDSNSLSEKQRVAFYDAMFAMAAADGQMQREELELIYETLDTEGLSEEARRRLYAYAIEPPALQDCLQALSDAPESARHGLMLNLVEVAVSDYLLSNPEREALTQGQLTLGISNEQRTAMEHYAEEVRRIRERGIDDNHAADVLKAAVSGMTAVGIPIAAVVYSGSVVGLSAAGITSGLAALGFGAGMIPGIGVAILIGTAAFVGLNYLFDTGNKRKKEQHRRERERKAQLAMENLQETINHLISRMARLQGDAADAKANREAIELLNERLAKLQQVLARRREDLAHSA